MTATSNAIKQANIAGNAAADKIAENIVALDVSALMPLTDIFLLASGRNERQVSSIADEIEDKMLESGFKTLRREGKELGRWILLDFGDIVCHVMHEEDRMYYSLERNLNCQSGSPKVVYNSREQTCRRLTSGHE